MALISITAIRGIIGIVVITLGAAALFYAGYQQGRSSGVQAAEAMTADWQKRLEAMEQEKLLGERERGDDFEVLAVRLADMQSDLLRLEAVGRKLLFQSGAGRPEIDNRLPLGQGGPETSAITRPAKEHILQTMLETEQRLRQTESSFEKLETHYLALTERALTRAYPQGYPVKNGWISSKFGVRADPFNGQMAIHNGVDFAGKEGSAIVAVAPGVVIRAGSYSGYGQLVELDHGNNYVTRYGHNRQLLVRPGQRVSKGQVLAEMGSSGRSTGPHLHFEVLYGGRFMDPMQFIVASR